jgi:protein-disulfide isomerase
VSFRSCLPLLLSVATLAALGCHAQTPAPGAVPAAAPVGKPLPPAVAFRVEALLRRKADLPPGSSINIAVLGPAKAPGFQRISISFSNEGRTSKAMEFLLSDDTKTLEQVTSFDMAADPKSLLPPTDRPYRGGPKTAPVLIIGFDDLECPFCAKLHGSLFPAITERYGDKVHIEYRDFPLDQHPWALRAAVDVNCLAAESPAGYWDAVDYIHAHASDVGADPKDAKADKTMPRAEQQLDGIVRDEGAKQKVDMTKLNACLTKQERTGVDTSRQLAESLNLQSTPTLFINGDKIDGAVPLEFLFGVIDNALRAEGVTPPPPYVAPKIAAPAPAAATPAATKGR